MARGIVLLDVPSPFPSITLHDTITPSRSSTSSSSSLSSLSVLIIILSSALVLSIFLYLLLRYLSRRPPSSLPVTVKRGRDCNNNNLSLPLFTFSSLTSKTNTETDAADCAICLASFEPTDQLRLLPLCCHAFHTHCIDTWLSSSHDTCPLCRSTVYPTDAQVLDNTPLPSLTRGNSYRIEIGSLSQRRGPETQEAARRSYSVGPFEYVVQEGYEVDKDVVAGEGGEVAGRSWLMDYVDRLSSRTFSRRGSGGFRNGSVRRGEGVANGDDREASRFGEEISEIFRWLSGV